MTGESVAKNKEYAAKIETYGASAMEIRLAHVDQLMDAMRKCNSENQ